MTVGQFAGASAAYLSLLLKRARDAFACEIVAIVLLALALLGFVLRLTGVS